MGISSKQYFGGIVFSPTCKSKWKYIVLNYTYRTLFRKKYYKLTGKHKLVLHLPRQRCPRFRHLPTLQNHHKQFCLQAATRIGHI